MGKLGLQSIETLGEAGIAALKIVQASAHRLVKAELLFRPVLRDR